MGENCNSEITSVYQGKTYYLCCAGCKTKFERTPDAYLHAAMPDVEGMEVIPLTAVS